MGHQPIHAEGRTGRLVQRVHQKKSMKNRIKNLRVAARVAFQAGRESVLMATEGMEYGAAYEVGVVPTAIACDSGTGWPAMAGLQSTPV